MGNAPVRRRRRRPLWSSDALRTTSFSESSFHSISAWPRSRSINFFGLAAEPVFVDALRDFLPHLVEGLHLRRRARLELEDRNPAPGADRFGDVSGLEFVDQLLQRRIQILDMDRTNQAAVGLVADSDSSVTSFV
jgi:hypothetical protein